MKWFIGLAHLGLGQAALKTNPSQAVYHFEQSITSYQETKADATFMELLHGIILLTKGNLRKGVKALEVVSEVFLKNGSLWGYITTEYLLSTIYLQIVLGEGPKTLPFFAKNITFLIKSAPRAPEKADYHLHKVIETAKEIGAKSMLGQAYLDLGLLHKAKGKTDQARECITESIRIFEHCEAEGYLKQAKEALASFG